MMLKIHQSAMHVMIDIAPYGPFPHGRYTVRKGWGFVQNSQPNPALVITNIGFTYQGEKGAMLPETAEEHIRWLQVCVDVARQLDTLLKTREDFGRKMEGEVEQVGEWRRVLLWLEPESELANG